MAGLRRGRMPPPRHGHPKPKRRSVLLTGANSPDHRFSEIFEAGVRYRISRPRGRHPRGWAGRSASVPWLTAERVRQPAAPEGSHFPIRLEAPVGKASAAMRWRDQSCCYFATTAMFPSAPVTTPASRRASLSARAAGTVARRRHSGFGVHLARTPSGLADHAEQHRGRSFRGGLADHAGGS